MKSRAAKLNAHVHRYVEAIALGHIADLLFEAECRRRGLPLDECLRAPLDSVSIPVAAYSGGNDARH